MLNIYSHIYCSLGSRNNPSGMRRIKKTFLHLITICLFIYIYIYIYIYHTKLHCLAECPIRFTHYFGLWGYADTGTAFIGFMLK